MDGAELCSSDLAFLTGAITSGNQPKLLVLCLTGNNLGLMKQDVKNLVVSCIDQYKHVRLNLWLGDNNLSEKFQEEIKPLCQGMTVKLILQHTLLKN